MRLPIRGPLAVVASLPLYASGQLLSTIIHLPGMGPVNALHKKLLAASKRVEAWAGVHVMWDAQASQVVVNKDEPKP